MDDKLSCPGFIVGARCTGGHEHSKLEGSKRTAQASRYPTALVQGIVNTIKRVKGRLADANHARDPAHFMIPETLRQTEDEISLVCNRKQMSIYDMQPPPQISVDQILIRMFKITGCFVILLRPLVIGQGEYYRSKKMGHGQTMTQEMPGLYWMLEQLDIKSLWYMEQEFPLLIILHSNFAD